MFISGNKKTSKIETPCLVGAGGEFEGQVIQLLDRLSLGRNPENDLCLQDCAVSGFHAEVIKVGNNYKIRDMGSKNKTKVNGRKIFKPMVLANNDLIEIGKNTFQFQQPAVKTATASVTMPIGPRVKPAGDQETVHTQKIPEHVFTPAKPTSRKTDRKHLTKKAARSKTKTKQPTATPKTKPSKARKIIVNTISACLAVFIIGLAATKLINVDLDGRHAGQGKSVSRSEEYLFDPDYHLSCIKEIWATWDRELSTGNPDEQKSLELFNHANALSGRIGADNPRNAWLAYKSCLDAIASSKSAEQTKRCERLLRTLKIQIEDEEKRYMRILHGHKRLHDWDLALSALQYNIQLLDFNNDNKGNKLARLYRDLEYEIKKQKKVGGER